MDSKEMLIWILLILGIIWELMALTPETSIL